MFKNWFNTLKISVSQPRKFTELSKRSFWNAYGFLYLLLFIGFFIKTAIFSSGIFVALPAVQKQLPTVKTRIQNAYPADLKIEIRNGQAITNVQQPYTITLNQVIPELKLTQNLVTIDTTASVEDYTKYNSLVLLTKTNLVYPNRNSSEARAGIYEVMPLTKVQDPISINKQSYDVLAQQILPFVDKVPDLLRMFAIMAVLVFPFIGAFFFLAGILIYLLVMSLILLLISKLLKKAFSYKSLYKMSMFGMTVPLVASELATLLKLQIPGLNNLLFLGWMIYVLTLNRPAVYTQNNARSKKVSSR